MKPKYKWKWSVLYTQLSVKTSFSTFNFFNFIFVSVVYSVQTENTAQQKSKQFLFWKTDECVMWKNKGSYETTPFWVLHPPKYKNINITNQKFCENWKTIEKYELIWLSLTKIWKQLGNRIVLKTFISLSADRDTLDQWKI